MKRRVLTIDDDPAIRGLIRAAMLAAGHDVEEAVNGALGLERALAQPPDLILLDVEMPILDGRETVARLKADPRTRDIPVIMLTGLSDSAHAVAGLVAGADEYLAKPVPVRELRARADAMLRLRALQEDLVRLERERHEARLALAREVQQSLLPEKIVLPGWDVAVRYVPCEALGGDFYDVLETPVGPMLVLGDAEGHGPAAALWMATARAYLRASAATCTGPAQLLSTLNTLISTDRRHTALLPLMCLLVEPERIVYANAGHEAPFVVRRGGSTESLDSTGPLLGVVQDVTFEELLLESPAALVAFTDGLTEAMNAEKQPFGRDRIPGLVGSTSASTADRLQDAWKHHANAAAHDDMTVLALHRA